MRVFIFLLAALQIGLFIYFGLGFGTAEPFSSFFEVQGFVTLVGIALAVSLIPALILASVGRFMGVALALALAPISALVLISFNI